MKRHQQGFALVMVGVLMLVLAGANAQERGGASQRGGSYGSPGMAGATNNTQNGRSTSSITAGFSGQSARGDRTQGGAAGLLGGDRAQGAAGFQGFGGGFQARASQQRGAGVSWSAFGGFGTGIQTNAQPSGAAIDSTQWQGSVTIPAAPASLDETDALYTAQQAARVEAVIAAQDTAQQTYDQFWADYYAAVDVAADAYYQTVTASVDYAQQAYYDALNYTVQTTITTLPILPSMLNTASTTPGIAIAMCMMKPAELM